MKSREKSFYRALLARDARFDGLFFVGVTSTGIYCRPVCPVKPPKFANCRFYNSAQEAEHAGFRPCLRCRPELAPGSAPMDSGQRIAQLFVKRIEEEGADGEPALEAIAEEFGLSLRQMRRIILKELGVPPIQLLLTRRLLLAKQLLTETRLSIIDVAFASGFASLRRFNDAFGNRYGMPPTRLRKQARGDADAGVKTGTSQLLLAFRPPYDWLGVLDFLRAREMKGVELVTESFYARSVHLGNVKGWIKVTRADKKNALLLEFTHSLTPALPPLLNRVRDLFDLNARPDLIAKHLRKDPKLRRLVRANPGLRVPGSFNGFELGVRAILGQQITVKAGTTLAGRFATAFGERISTPFQEINRLSPSPEVIARTAPEKVSRLGIIGARSRCIQALAKAQIRGELSLESSNHHDPEETIRRLAEIPGIGYWTANYVAMRALRWPDAFANADIALRNRLGRITARQAEVMSQAWRPWRSYAMLHILHQPVTTGIAVS